MICRPATRLLTIARMNPLALLLPLLLIIGGIVCFFVLPLPVTLRAVILTSDILVAGIVALVLIKRGR
jgi:hypothetical protein